MVMENNSQDKGKKHSPEDLADLIDEIDREAKDVTDLVIPEDSIIDDTDLDSKEESMELDPDLFAEEDLQLGLETAEHLAGPSTDMKSVETDSEINTDTTVDTNGKDGRPLAEKEAASSHTEELDTTGMSNDLASIMKNRIEKVVTRLVEERMSNLVKQSSKDSSQGSKEVPGLARKRDIIGKGPNSGLSTNELAILMNKKIEKVVTRKVEEQIPAIAEKIVLETIKKILLSVE